jgi:phosphate:Na+ symporter
MGGVPLMLIDLAGAVALLLWGVRMVQTGVQRAFGPRLRLALASALRNRLNAFLAGLGVTAVLQSSTATGPMITSFAAGGGVGLVPALAVMLGANVGTTLIVQVLSFDISRAAPALVLLGVVMFRRGATTRTRDLGRVAVGLGLMLIALHHMLDVVTPYESAPALRAALGAIAAEPVVAMLLAAALTWAAHSSMAVVLLVMSLAAKGVVAPEAAFALVLGANLGTAINPVLEGAAGDDPAARRLPLGNLLNRALGCAAALLALPAIAPLIMAAEADPARAVADFHTAFNLVLAALFLPLLAPYAALLQRLVPARLDPADPSRPVYLDRAALETPAVAIGAAAREALRLADLLEAMLRGVRDAFDKDDRKRIAETRRADGVLDALDTAIKAYLTALDPAAMTDADHRRVEQVLAFDEPGARRRRGGPEPDDARLEAAEARPRLLPRGAGGADRHDRPADRQPAHRRLRVHDRGPQGGQAAGGREGGVPRPRSGGDAGAFRTAARRRRRDGRERRAAPRRHPRPEACQRAHRRGRGLPGAQEPGRAAADAAADRDRGLMHATPPSVDPLCPAPC